MSELVTLRYLQRLLSHLPADIALPPEIVAQIALLASDAYKPRPILLPDRRIFNPVIAMLRMKVIAVKAPYTYRLGGWGYLQ